MYPIFRKMLRTGLTLLAAFFLLYCLFERPIRIRQPEASGGDLDIVIKETVELEGQTLIFDYAVPQYSGLESLVAASDRILVGEYGRDGQFTPSEALKGDMGGPFPIHFPVEPTFTAHLSEEGKTVDVELTAPSPLRHDFNSALNGPKLVFLRLDTQQGYVPVGDPWIADVYTNEKLATRSRLSGSHEVAAIAEGETEYAHYRKKVVFCSLSRPKTDEFLNDLTLQDIRNAAQ